MKKEKLKAALLGIALIGSLYITLPLMALPLRADTSQAEDRDNVDVVRPTTSAQRSVQVPTMREFKKLQSDVKELQRELRSIKARVAELCGPPPAVEPPVDPPTRPDPPVIVDPPTTNPGRAPPIEVYMKPRDRRAFHVSFAPGEVKKIAHDGLGFHCYRQKAGTLDAWMVTVAIINGYTGRGPAYFEELRITSGDRILEKIEGKHVILPRGAIIRRFWLGPDAERAKLWDWVEDDRPVPVWAHEKASEALGKFAATVGPYEFQWDYKSLDNSHGGHGVAPFHGGPDDWLTCGAGRRLREQEMLSEYQRPIWLLGTLPQEPYWMGRTMDHRLKGYNQDPDDWCEYAVPLNGWRPADDTHLSRTTAGAAALARWDLFARDCLLNSFDDFKTANSLTRPVESPEGGRLLWPLWYKVEVADGPLNSEGHRGLAHKLRLLRWCRPYVNADVLDLYQDAYREWAHKMASMYGFTRMTSPTVPAAAPLVAPYIQAFHQQLNLYEFQQFGGLDDLAKKLAPYLTSNPPWYFETRDGAPDDTCYTHDFKADNPNALATYGAMTHGIMPPNFTDAADLLRNMEGRGVNGSSQELDNIPRALWEPGL